MFINVCNLSSHILLGLTYALKKQKDVISKNCKKFKKLLKKGFEKPMATLYLKNKTETSLKKLASF